MDQRLKSLSKLKRLRGGEETSIVSSDKVQVFRREAE